ncbi:transglycosylase family protein [Streptomyces turgidiscabies]|uniref:Transglycosylase-like domain protein n=1 Tax=Streptomyces turgidiscabies (strain Car8) TaxID=698760 RepID=L7EUH3_STRT8|nr:MULTISPECIES: transglycosylase family protein [Streptomyces]ELP62371.1 transglycosylase-like domain protein [Streptomyces turgidiscabies Car8]MDX3493462.1 transglycosylase family protein [Streptomyces turgidiscabies]GAQ70768.1 resuscitation-promoting factor RpfA precursor [Streptomyces turgidiscabies]
MLSGNGRHRRPRQAPALLVSAGVAGSAIAIPLLGATGASAASGTTWDRVAECESGGSWSANSGNGFYGGLQLTQADWEKYGGLSYAPSADQASRSQQIAVGEKILDDQGAGAWEACALLSGLGKDTGSADVDTGVAGGDTDASKGDASGLGLGVISGSGSDSSSSSSTSASPTPSVSPSTGSSALTGGLDSSPSPTPSSGATTGSAGVGDPAGSSASPSPSASSPSADGSKESDSSPVGSVKGQEAGKSGQKAENEGGASSTETPAGTGRHRGKAEGSYTGSIGDALWDVTGSLDLVGGQSESTAGSDAFLDSDSGLVLPGQILAVGSEPGQN